MVFFNPLAALFALSLISPAIISSFFSTFAYLRANFYRSHQSYLKNLTRTRRHKKFSRIFDLGAVFAQSIFINYHKLHSPPGHVRAQRPANQYNF